MCICVYEIQVHIPQLYYRKSDAAREKGHDVMDNKCDNNEHGEDDDVIFDREQSAKEAMDEAMRYLLSSLV